MNDIKSQLFIPSPTDMDPFCDAIEYVGIEDEAERNALVAKYKEEGAKASRERGLSAGRERGRCMVTRSSTFWFLIYLF